MALTIQRAIIAFVQEPRITVRVEEIKKELTYLYEQKVFNEAQVKQIYELMVSLAKEFKVKAEVTRRFNSISKALAILVNSKYKAFSNGDYLSLLILSGAMSKTPSFSGLVNLILKRINEDFEKLNNKKKSLVNSPNSKLRFYIDQELFKVNMIKVQATLLFQTFVEIESEAGEINEPLILEEITRLRKEIQDRKKNSVLPITQNNRDILENPETAKKFKIPINRLLDLIMGTPGGTDFTLGHLIELINLPSYERSLSIHYINGNVTLYISGEGLVQFLHNFGDMYMIDINKLMEDVETTNGIEINSQDFVEYSDIRNKVTRVLNKLPIVAYTALSSRSKESRKSVPITELLPTIKITKVIASLAAILREGIDYFQYSDDEGNLKFAISKRVGNILLNEITLRKVIQEYMDDKPLNIDDLGIVVADALERSDNSSGLIDEAALVENDEDVSVAEKAAEEAEQESIKEENSEAETNSKVALEELNKIFFSQDPTQSYGKEDEKILTQLLSTKEGLSLVQNINSTHISIFPNNSGDFFSFDITDPSLPLPYTEEELKAKLDRVFIVIKRVNEALLNLSDQEIYNFHGRVDQGEATQFDNMPSLKRILMYQLELSFAAALNESKILYEDAQDILLNSFSNLVDKVQTQETREQNEQIDNATKLFVDLLTNGIIKNSHPFINFLKLNSSNELFMERLIERIIREMRTGNISSFMIDDEFKIDSTITIPDMYLIPAIKKLFFYIENRNMRGSIKRDAFIELTMGAKNIINEFSKNYKIIINYSTGQKRQLGRNKYRLNIAEGKSANGTTIIMPVITWHDHRG